MTSICWIAFWKLDTVINSSWAIESRFSVKNVKRATCLIPELHVSELLSQTFWTGKEQFRLLKMYLYWEQSFKFSTFQPSWLWAWEISLLSFIPTSLCSLEHSRFLPRYWFPKGPVLWKILLTPRVTQHYSVETGQKQRYRQRLVSNWRSLYV